MTIEARTYTDELLMALRMLDVPGPRIAEALAEVDSHVSETGEDPREAFGEPRTYAAELSTSLGLPPAVPLWRSFLTWGALAHGVAGAGGSWLLLQGVLALSDTSDGSDGSGVGALGLPGAAVAALGLVVLLGLTLSIGRLAGQDDSRVIDPRSGDDMAPPLPRWVRPMLLLPLLVLAVAAVVLAAR